MMAPFLFKAPLGQHLCASLSVAPLRFPAKMEASSQSAVRNPEFPSFVAYPVAPSRFLSDRAAGEPYYWQESRIPFAFVAPLVASSRFPSTRAAGEPFFRHQESQIQITNPNHKSKSQIQITNPHPLPFLGIPFHFGPLIQKILAAHLKSNPF
jgi:hypothetical protein